MADESTLDPQSRALLDRIIAANAPLYETLPVAQARALYDQAGEILKGAPPEMFGLDEISIPGPGGNIPATVYRPTKNEQLPVFVFYHGGGYVIGSPTSHDAVCRGIAAQAECLVVSVDYRLAPEHKYPAAVDDAWAALLWVARNAEELGADVTRLAVGGDSAGGNLAAVVSLMARDQKGPELQCQILIYPGTDLTCDYPSHSTFGTDYSLTTSLVDWFMGHYFNANDDRSHWTASPLNAANHSNLPPAFILSAGFDPLQDEEVAYVQKLQEAGNDVSYSHYEGMIHGFITMPGVMDKALEAISECAKHLKKAFAR